ELTAGGDNVLIVHSSSEGSNRMIREEGVVGYGKVVQVIGGRFALNGLSAYDSMHGDSPDGSWIKFVHSGPLVIDGIELDTDINGIPNNIKPTIHFSPPAGLPGNGETLDVRNVHFNYPNSADDPPIDVGGATNARVNTSGNMCSDSGGVRR